MICPECNGMGETVYYVETARDENTVTMEQRKGICRTCNGSGEKPMTNAYRIRSMTDDELNELFHEIYNAGAEDVSAYEWGQRTNSFEWTMDWLKQPAEDNKNG